MSATLAGLVLVLTLAAPAIAQEQEQARIIAIGNINRLEIGQEGYCGKKTMIPHETFENIVVDGDKRIWIYIAEVQGIAKCLGVASFTPKPATTYVIRSTWQGRGNNCILELFRVGPGNKPVRDSIQIEEQRTCLPW
jgi:hypothetical protein